MATKLDNHDEESFIILGTSPGTSLDVKCNGIPVGDSPMNKADMEDAMKDLPVEANMAFKAYFKFGDGPSPASMMVASSIVAEDKSTDELQKKFGEILDENVILKETLKQNNESMKEQFLLIASCQEDMLRTHQMHKEKFDETRGLVEKLRQENKKLKLDMSRLIDSASAPNSQPNGSAPASLTKSQSSDKSSDKSAPTSTIEFVTAPDDDTINKLTAQLELVEKQRRQVIVDNEKLTWQKESLETIVDVTSRERDELKEKLKNSELQHSKKEEEYVGEINKLNFTIEDLQMKLQTSTSFKGLSSEESKQRDITIQQLEVKVAALQNELKTAQLKILDLESVKLEFSRQKAGTSEIVKIYKDQINDLHNRLKEAQTTVFQPVRISLSSEPETSTSEYASLMSNVKLYDRTLKHLSELLNSITHGTSESLMDALGLVTSLHEYKLDRTSADNVKSGLCEVKQLLQRVHSDSLSNKGQIQGTLSIFEGIFQDHKELLKKALCKQEIPSSKPTVTSVNVEALTNALTARGKELESTKEEMRGLLSTITAMQLDKEDNELLKAQIEVYKGDFEAERESRQKLASEKESVATDLRTAQRRNQELTELLEEVRKINPAIYQSATSKKKRATPAAPHPTSPRAAAAAAAQPATPASSRGSSTGNMVYTCPKCMRFSSDQYKVMEDHFDFCLDDLM